MFITLLYGSLISPLIALIIGFKKKVFQKSKFKYIWLLLLVSFFSDFIMMILSKSGINNMPVAHIYGILEANLLFLCFLKCINKSYKYINIVIIVFSIYYLFNSIFIENIFEFNAYARSIEALIMIVFSIIYFHKIYTDEVDIFLDKSPLFWIVIGILFYFSGALFSFILSSDILSKAPDRFYNSWILHNSVNIIKNVLFAIGLWKVRAVA